MILQDRSLAGMAARFATFLSWIYLLPHYWRLSGTATAITDVAELSAPEIVREIVAHLGGPTAETEMRRWLAKNFVKFSAAQHAVAWMRHRQMLAGIDAKFGKAVYELRAPFAECRQRLDALPAVMLGELSDEELDEGLAEARDWSDVEPKGKQLTLPGGAMMLGRVLLGQSHWRLEAMGAKKLAQLRRLFEKQLGERVRFSGERVDDLGARLSGKEPAADETLVPPRLLENPEQIALQSSRVPALPPGVSPQDAENELMRAAERAFLDDPIPMFKNRTPREAASDPAWRPTLIQLMKERVRSHDERNLKTGRNDDINWRLRELKLDEIIFDAPPWRPPPAPMPDDEDDFSEPADFAGEVEANRPPAPRLPPAPFDFDEAITRLEAALDLFDTAAAAEKELSASSATLLMDAEEMTRGELSENDFCFAIPFLLQTWFAFVPRPGYRF